MGARLLPAVAALLLPIVGCGDGGGHGAGEALPATTTYYSCDETYTMGGGPLHLCLEYSQDAAFATPSANACPPTANGYTGSPGNGLSTTKRCPRDVPGCVCVHEDDMGRHYEEFRYQSADLDAVQSATKLCQAYVAGMISCFGGLTAPADAGAP